MYRIINLKELLKVAHKGDSVMIFKKILSVMHSFDSVANSANPMLSQCIRSLGRGVGGDENNVQF